MAKRKTLDSDSKATKAKRKRKEVATIPVIALEPDLLTVKGPAERHRERMALRKTKRPLVDDDNKADFIARMRQGELPIDICDDLSLPPYSAFRRTMQDDDAFASEYEEAFRVMADLALNDAQAFARECASTGNIDQMRIADIYGKSLALALEKLAPRDYGALIKHAGAEGGPLQVNVISYAKQLGNG